MFEESHMAISYRRPIYVNLPRSLPDTSGSCSTFNYNSTFAAGANGRYVCTVQSKPDWSVILWIASSIRVARQDDTDARNYSADIAA